MSKANWPGALGIVGVAAAAILTFGMNTVALADLVAPEGIWYTTDDESIIRVKLCAGSADSFCGTLVWLKEPNEADGSPKVDKLNKDPAKKNKPMIGVVILREMKADDDHWTGKAYNPEDGKIYDITFKVKTDKEPNDQADLRGCLFSILCKTETFTRAKEIPGGEPVLLDDAAPVKKHKGAKKQSVSK